MSECARIIAALMEGNSLRTTSPLCGVAFNTVLKLLPEIGVVRSEYHFAHVRGVRAKRTQYDEIFQFVGTKSKSATPEWNPAFLTTFGALKDWRA